MRKNILGIGVVLALCIYGCIRVSQSNAYGNEPQVIGQQTVTVPTEWALQVAFIEPIVNEAGEMQEVTLDLTLYIPKNWAEGNTEY